MNTSIDEIRAEPQTVYWWLPTGRETIERNTGGKTMNAGGKTMKRTLVSAAAALVLPIVNAANPPEVKEGLWSVHTQTSDNSGGKKSEGTYTLCRNHAYDQAAQARAKNMKGCTMVSESFEGGKYTSAMHCVTAGTAVESKGTTTFQGDAATHSETHATYTPAVAGMTEMTIVMDQKYVGSCPAGVQPGDRTDADGKVIHLGKR
jgi:hypothetical protein